MNKLFISLLCFSVLLLFGCAGNGVVTDPNGGGFVQTQTTQLVEMQSVLSVHADMELTKENLNDAVVKVRDLATNEVKQYKYGSNGVVDIPLEKGRYDIISNVEAKVYVTEK